MSFSLGGISLSITGVSILMLSILCVAALGYLLGRITIKGVSLGTSGVFVTALLFGAFCYKFLSGQLVQGTPDGQAVSYIGNALKIVENIGLIFFVTAVGFIAGPKFFKNLKKNYKSFVLLGAIAIITGGLVAAACIFIGRESGAENDELTAIVVGLLSGALTSTPAFAATLEAVGPALEDAVTSGYAISYLFGVIGVVLFIQLVPKIVGADMDAEREKLAINHPSKKKRKEPKKHLIDIDTFGIMVFVLAGLLGIFVGSIKFFNFFSLTTTGGCLIVALVLGHFKRIGRINLTPQKKVLEVFRELGLVLFLIGAGISGGARFVEYFKVVYFIYGIFMTLIPMIVSYFFAKYVLKLSLLNNLGSVTGAMTSTPALGTLIHTAGTDDVASAYAATYPIALIAVVIVCQLLTTLL